jgi:hypothetical protein
MSASQLLSGSPALLNVPVVSQVVQLGAGGTLTITPPFPVDQTTMIVVTPFGLAPLGTYWVSRVFGATGAGSFTIQSTNAGDAGKNVCYLLFKDGDDTT